MTVQDRQRYSDLLAKEDTCRLKAEEAIGQGSSVGAREWMDAADACRRLANRIKAGADA